MSQKELISQPVLKKIFRDHFLMGVAVNQVQCDEQDAVGCPLIQEHYNSITPENVMKWERIYPQSGKYNFDPADRFVAYGKKYGMKMIGHTLVWHNQTPPWVFKDSHGKPVDRETLLQRMHDHIGTIVGRYKGQLLGWDVVNEAVDEDGTLRQSPWLKIIGEDFIEKAFLFAHEADPSMELYYNDYSLESEPKRKGALKVIAHLINKGIPIHAVGLQGHYKMDWPSKEQISATIEDFGKLGVQVMITELDVDVVPATQTNRGADIVLNAQMNAGADIYAQGLPESIQEKLAKRYADLFDVFRRHKELTRVTFWGADDADSWLNTPGRTNYPLLFDRKGRPKQAFHAVMAAMTE